MGLGPPYVVRASLPFGATLRGSPAGAGEGGSAPFDPLDARAPAGHGARSIRTISRPISWSNSEGWGSRAQLASTVSARLRSCQVRATATTSILPPGIGAGRRLGRPLRHRSRRRARRPGTSRRSRRALRPARRGRSRTLRRAEEGCRGRLGVTGGTTARFHTPGGLLRLARRRHAVADPVLGKDVGWRGGGVAELVAELLDDGAHAIGVVRAAAPPHLAQ